MQHPLVNPSLAPYGFVFPDQRTRLEYKPHPGWVNPEKLIAKAWDKANRLHTAGPRPVETIVHQILPGLATANRHFEADFEFNGLSYTSRDILVLSSIVQWLATNVGGCFLTSMPVGLEEDPRYHSEREFLLKLEYEENRSSRYMGQPKNMIVFWTHVCNEHCGSETIVRFWGQYHVYRFREASKRDHALAHGLMHWLGRKDGRAFTAAYLANRKRLERLELDRTMQETQARIATKKIA